MAHNHRRSSLTLSAAQVRSTEFKSGKWVLSNSEARGLVACECGPREYSWRGGAERVSESGIVCPVRAGGRRTRRTRPEELVTVVQALEEDLAACRVDSRGGMLAEHESAP